jgi:type I restriction enzyme S subunit
VREKNTAYTFDLSDVPLDAMPTGYKKTDAGVVPEDWEAKPLYALVDKIMVGIASAATHAYRDRGVVMFRNQNIKPNRLDDTDVLYIDAAYEEVYRNKRLKAGDLLTARTGYPGTTSIVPPQYEGAQSFTTLITRPRPSAIDSRYLCRFINSEVGQQYFERIQIGGGQKNVNAGSLKQLVVAMPPTKIEQEAITKFLSDADALIESLEQLIAKKRQIKQGTMQALLTGKQRLPGFRDEWQMRKVGELLSIMHGKSQHAVEDERGLYPILATGGQIGVASCFLYDKPSVLIGRKGTINRPQFMDQPFWSVDTLFYSVICEPNVAKFLFYRFCLIDWMQYNEASGVPSLNARTIEQVELKVPEADEQTAIATILTDMDAQLAALETRLGKTRQLKQGMMQELLTGRIRLI